MKALIKYKDGAGNIEVRNIPIPEIEADEVLIKVIACGICGTDLHLWQGEWEWKRPVVLGHEFVGKIVDIGSNVVDFSPDERVVTEINHSACGKCSYCKAGYEQMCSDRVAIGVGVDGAFAEYVKVPARLLHKLPKEIESLHAALMEPIAITIHGIIEKHQIVPSDTVVVIGPGPIGILSAQVARAVGAKKVIVLGTNKDETIRLKLCRDLGFTVYNVEKVALQDILSVEKCEYGVDVVVECAGSSKAMSTAVEITRKSGTILSLGIPGSEYINIPWALAVKKGITFKASYSSNYFSWQKAIPLLASKKIDVSSLISGIFPLEQWEEVFKALSRGEAIKCLLVPDNRDL